ncbi:MAG: hypothetical protein IPM85_10745 [Chitinophagaceae bacterium]|nr:hypothetical protein [Chitinophagaceae bacterium]
MRKLYFLLFTVLFTAISNAQIGVTVTGNTNTTPNLQASYTSLAAAITDLNTVTTFTGSVTFNLAAGTSESVTSQLNITLAGDPANAITFIKSGAGANPLVSRTDAGANATSSIGGLGDAVIRIDGTDNIHFNGLDVSASNQGIEYGYYTSKTATNACQNLSIRNAVITMTKGTSAYVLGIHIGNGSTSVSSATGVTVTANSGRTENVTITGNTIQNVHAGVYCRGSSAAGFYDQNFVVGQLGEGNTILNFGGGSATTTYGVYFIYVNNASVSYNTIDNAGGGGTAHGATLYGVFYSTVTGNIVGSNNTFTLNNNAASSSTYGLYNANTVSSELFNDNTFSAPAISSTGTMYLIYASNSTVGTKTINNNLISGTINRTGASGTFYCYYNNGSPGSGTEIISGNNFSNVTLAGTSTFYGINSTTAAGHSQDVNNNTISNITGGSGTMYGINLTSANTRKINNNNIFGLSGAGTVYGISNGSGGATSLGIYKNKVYDLSSSSTGTTAGLVTGILISSGTTNSVAKVYNNLIGNLSAGVSASTDAVRGIGITSTVATTGVELSYNSISINASSTGANFGTTGIYATANATASTANLVMRNNLIYNASTAAGTGLTVAFRRSATGFANYDATSNNNLFYAGTPSATNLIFNDGTNSDQTLAAYKARVSPSDASSVTENPPFLSTTGSSPAFLHINTVTATQLESGALPVTGITDDFDGDARNATTPDIGADEFNGISADLVGPAISYTPLSNPSCSNNVVLSATTTDASGVNTTAGTKPRIYFKKSADANTYAGNTSGDNGWKYAEASNSASPFSFTIDYTLLQSAVVQGDVINYFVVAQDMAGTPNVGVNSAVFSTPPSSVALTAGVFPVSSYNSYSIVAAPAVTVTADPNPVCANNPTTLVMVATQPGSVTTGSGTSTSSTYTPYYGSTTSARRIQYIVTAAELQALGLRAGNITTVSFNLASVPTAITIPDFTLKMGHTSLSVLTATFSADATQTVYSGSYSPVVGANTHTLTTAFNWNGTSNIIIEACHGIVGTASLTTVSYTSGLPSGITCYTTNALGCTQTTGTTTTIRPNITLQGQANVTNQYVNFIWNDGTGNVGTNNDTTIVNPPFPGAAISMTYSVTATDANGCTINGNVVVNKNTTTPTGTASANVSAVCVGKSVTLTATASSGCPPYTYSWSDGTTIVGTGAIVSVTPPEIQLIR